MDESVTRSQKGLVRNKYCIPFRESFRKLISRSPADVRNFAVRSSPKRRGKSERPHLANHTANTQDETLMTATEDEKLAAALDLLKRLPPSRVYTYLR